MAYRWRLTSHIEDTKDVNGGTLTLLAARPDGHLFCSKGYFDVHS